MLPLSVRQTFVILLIFISTFVLYQKCWNNPFVLDDLTKIQQNTDLRTAFAIENFVYPYSENSMHFRNDPSRPLTYILYWLCWQLGEGQPKPFHILITGLHALSGALVAVFTAELTLIFCGVFSTLAGLGAVGLFITSPRLASRVP